MTIAEEIKKRYPSILREMCEQECYGKKLDGDMVSYVFADNSEIKTKATDEDME